MPATSKISDIATVSLRDKVLKCTQLVEKEFALQYCACRKHTALPVIQFTKCDIFTHASVINIVWCWVGAIHNVIWASTLYSLLHGCELFGGAFWMSSHAM